MIRPSPGVPLNQAWGQKVRPVLTPHCLATLTRESGPVRTCILIFHLSEQFALPPLQHKKKLGNFFRPARRIRKFLQGPENRRGKEPEQSGQPPRPPRLRHPSAFVSTRRRRLAAAPEKTFSCSPSPAPRKRCSLWDSRCPSRHQPCGRAAHLENEGFSGNRHPGRSR